MKAEQSRTDTGHLAHVLNTGPEQRRALPRPPAVGRLLPPRPARAPAPGPSLHCENPSSAAHGRQAGRLPRAVGTRASRPGPLPGRGFQPGGGGESLWPGATERTRIPTSLGDW